MGIVALNEPALALLDKARVFHGPGNTRRWRVGTAIAVGDAAEIEAYSQVFSGYRLPAAMGAFSYSYSELRGHITIGRYCSIAPNVTWSDGDHPHAWATTSPVAYDPAGGPLQGVNAYFRDAGIPSRPLRRFTTNTRPNSIGHDVWIGDGAKIARGVNIGHGAVIGAGSLVLQDVPPYSVAFGVPARVRRLRFPAQTVDRLLALEWWRLPPEIVQSMPVDDPERFADAVEVYLASEPRLMAPAILTGRDIIAAATSTLSQP